MSYWTKIIYDVGKLQRAHPTLRGHFASAYLVGSNMLRAYLFFIYEAVWIHNFQIIEYTFFPQKVESNACCESSQLRKILIQNIGLKILGQIKAKALYLALIVIPSV